MAVTITVEGATYKVRDVIAKYKEIHNGHEISIETAYSRMRLANNYNELFRHIQTKSYVKEHEEKIPSTGDQLRAARQKNNDEFWKPFNKATRVSVNA